MQPSTWWRIAGGSGAALVLTWIVRPETAYYPAICYTDLWWLFWECYLLAQP